MRFLHKSPDSIVEYRQLQYPSDRNTAKDVLVTLQKGFCAYSERFLKPLDSVEVEHFDPRIKNTESDGFHNWHAVIRWMNSHKARRIQDYEPLPDLDVWSEKRVRYERGGFVCDDDDRESDNLIKFLGVNKPEVFEERSKQVALIRRLQVLCGDIESLHDLLIEHPENLSFPTALEAELGIPAFDLILRLKNADN